MSNAPVLVVNADDFGYFPEVSRGIAETATSGIVTATSLLVSDSTGESEIKALRALEHIDHGVHLNLSHGEPLTAGLSECFDDGKFPDKFSLIRQLLFGRVGVNDIEAEWRAQLTIARDGGLDIHFLNSHEHLHMFPGLYPRFLRLAREFGIPHLRYCIPEWSGPASTGRWLRNTVFAVTGLTAKRRPTTDHAHLLGVGPSGSLSRQYLLQVLPKLRPGRLYELMCHPGYGIPAGAGALTDYHSWDMERELLCDPSTRELIEGHGIRLARYPSTTLSS